MEVIPARIFNLLYIYIDIAWLIILLIILIFAKKYMAAIAGAVGAIIYFIVDYGIFYLALGTRTVEGANTAALLFWLSASYGFTNFAWIWLWLDRDGHALEWSVLIISAWFATALLSQNFGAGFPLISIQRGTASYHGVMALLMFAGYAILIIYNLKNREKKDKKFNILWILAIGILVQFSWEAVLLVTGIRATAIMPLIVNSLIETNMGLPFIFLIHRTLSSRFSEELKRKGSI
ncbi:MAG: hypothetical protein JW997_03190 [Actinobacteria bacterium]|nr:hypothetical protein [Actinomycetota bacterium]